MNINRHNYEEAFLLYVDNELSATDRAAVDEFVLKNKDLANELAMLLQATLLPNEMVPFDFKAQLIKSDTDISIDNCETYFLLDVDGELNATQKQEVERFVLQHPAVQPAYTLLHQTRLEPEAIVFTDKALLYKTPHKRVVPFTWMKFAAAAIITGLVATLYFVVPPAKNTVENNTNNTAELPKKSGSQTNQIRIPGTDLPSVNDSEKAATTGAPATVKPLLVKQPKPVAKNDIAKSIAVNKKATVEAKSNNGPQRNFAIDVVAANPTNNDPTQDLATTITLNNTVKNNPLVQAKTEDKQATIATLAVYKEIDTQKDESENSFLFGSARINKNKLRGLLKKASGLFDKKADKNESEKTIQIASFEIKGK